MDNGDIRQDFYYCKCGLNFSAMASLQAHWDDPTRDKNKKHYRANADGTDYFPGSRVPESTEPDLEEKQP